MKDKVNKSNFDNWSIEKGDYKRDETSTWRFHKKMIWRKRLKSTLFIILYIVFVSIVAFFIFS
jgi:hypothetical protein